MKLGIVVEWLDRARGGAETSTGQFIDQMLARDVSLVVFTRSVLPAGDGLDVRTIQTRSRSRAGATAEFIRAAEGAIGAAGCDLVHAFIPCVGADVYQPRGGLVAETIRRTAATRRTPLGRGFKRMTMRLIARQRMVLGRERAWLKGDRQPMVIAISRYVEAQLRTHYDYPESHTRYILNGVDVADANGAVRAANRRQIRERFGVSDDDVLWLQVCHNFRLKGVGCVMEALSSLRERGVDSVKVLVVGRGRVGSWETKARRLRLGDMHRFIGPADDIGAFYHAADALAHPTYYDPCSRVVLEAVVHGLPVIGSGYDGAAEVVEDGISGFVLPEPDRIAALADRIQQLCDGGVRRAMATAALERGGGGALSMSRHVDEVLSMYEGMSSPIDSASVSR